MLCIQPRARISAHVTLYGKVPVLLVGGQASKRRGRGPRRVWPRLQAELADHLW